MSREIKDAYKNKNSLSAVRNPKNKKAGENLLF